MTVAYVCTFKIPIFAVYGEIFLGAPLFDAVQRAFSVFFVNRFLIGGKRHHAVVRGGNLEFILFSV